MRAYTQAELMRVNAKRPRELHKVHAAWIMDHIAGIRMGARLLELATKVPNEYIYAVRAFGQERIFYDGSYTNAVAVLRRIGYTGPLPYNIQDDASSSP